MQYIIKITLGNKLYAPLQSRKDRSVSFRRTPARAFTPRSPVTITTRNRKAAKYSIIVVAKETKIISYRERIARQNAKRCHVRKARSIDNNAHAHDAFKYIFFYFSPVQVKYANTSMARVCTVVRIKVDLFSMFFVHEYITVLHLSLFFCSYLISSFV